MLWSVGRLSSHGQFSNMGGGSGARTNMLQHCPTVLRNFGRPSTRPDFRRSTSSDKNRTMSANKSRILCRRGFAGMVAPVYFFWSMEWTHVPTFQTCSVESFRMVFRQMSTKFGGDSESMKPQRLREPDFRCCVFVA